MGIFSKSKEEGNTDDATTASPEGSNPFIASKRKCTDILCLVFFLVFWLGMFIIAGVGFSNGQPEKLIFGVDWKGRTCGAKVSEANGDIPAYDFTSYKNMLYPRLTEDLFDLQVSGASLTDPRNLNKFFGICVETCPAPTDIDGNQLYAHAYLDYISNPNPVNTIIESSGSASENTAAGSPWLIALNTTNILFRCIDQTQLNTTASARCVDDCENGEMSNCGNDVLSNPFMPCGAVGCTMYAAENFPKCRKLETEETVIKTGAAKTNPIYDSLNSSWQLVNRWIGDIEKSAIPVLLCGGLFAIILGFVWLLMLKYCAGFFVWLSILLVIAMFLGVTLYAAYRGELIDPSNVSGVLERAGVSATDAADVNTFFSEAGFQGEKDLVHYWAIACYVFVAVDVIVLLLLVFLCNRIKIAIGIIREASKAVQAMPFLIAFPILPTVSILLLVIYWVITAAYVASSGEINLKTVTDSYNANVTVPASYGLAEYSDNNLMNYMLMYHLFGFLWTNQFLQSLGYIIIAGAVAEYYWTLDKTKIQKLPILRSTHRALRFHLGTVAFGSLIIAIVQAVRLVLEYIDNKTKQAQEGNKFVKAAMMCCKCFLWCFEKCLKFLNKNAYIIVAMKGTGFCNSMKEAFTLLMANAARVATVGIVSNFLLLLGKLFIVALSTLTMFLFIQNPPEKLPSFFLGDMDNISSPLFPMLLVAMLSYGVASFFLGVYETSIDTILLCFCEDCSVNKTSGSYYMSDELLSFVDGAAKKNAFRQFKKTGGDNEA